MARYLVTRHDGILEWARRQKIEATIIPHLDRAMIARFGPGDEFIGPLPIHLIAAITARGAVYKHIEFDVPQGRRGGELTADEMQLLGAQLVRYRAEPIEG